MKSRGRSRKAVLSALIIVANSTLGGVAFCFTDRRFVPSSAFSTSSRWFPPSLTRLNLSKKSQDPQKQELSAIDEDKGNETETLLFEPTTAKISTTSKSSSQISKPILASKRKMDLMWCTADYCKDVVRERVVGDHNQVVLNGPATGQVAYQWSKVATSDVRPGKASPTKSSVLILIKPNDDTLEEICANAVKELTREEIEVLLVPDVAAKLKHYHGVDDDRIGLFDLPSYRQAVKHGLLVGELGDDVWYGESFADGHTHFPDLVCTLGGDGLLMHASMMFQGPVPPIISIAGGSLGFLTPFSPHEMVDAIQIALGLYGHGVDSNGNSLASPSDGDSSDDDDDNNTHDDLEVFPPNMSSYPYEPLVKAPHVQDSTRKVAFGFGDSICLSIRMRLDCRIVTREGVVRARYNVLNEVVIDRGSSPYLAALECFCDDVHLTTVQADGVIFATPTGSTAYSMAAGGSVVHPAVPSILVTPICPHVLSFRSMIFPDHVVLRCYVPEDARSPASVAFDGKHRQELQRGDSIQIQMSNYPVPTVNRGDHSSDWLESLKRSFNFNTRPRQRPL